MHPDGKASAPAAQLSGTCKRHANLHVHPGRTETPRLAEGVQGGMTRCWGGARGH